MADIVKKPVEITETILRDAHQSLIATKTSRIVFAANGKDFVNSVMDSKIQNFRCYSVDRTS